jgi:rubrerythrin
MTDAVAIALIAGGFGAISATVTTVGAVISAKARAAAEEAAKKAGTAIEKVEEVHGQAVENWSISQANHDTLTKVVANTDGNVRKLQEAWAAEAQRRETAAWAAAFEAGRRAEMTKSRRATDVLPEPAPVNDDEPKE